MSGKNSEGREHRISPMGHTWIFDLDGTLLKHNGYLMEGEDTLLEGAQEFFHQLSEKDIVILLTSRKETYRKETESFLQKNGIRYDYILFDIPYGERILVNDRKPSGLQTAYGINTERDCFMKDQFIVDEEI